MKSVPDGPAEDAGIGRASEGQPADVAHPCVRHHVRDFSFGVRAALLRVHEHVQAEKRWKERAVVGVVQQKIVNQNESARFDNRNRLFDDHMAALWTHAVKNLGNPRNIVGSSDHIVQVIPCLEADPGAQPESLDRLSSKGLRAGEIEHCSSELGVGLTKMNGVGSRPSP